MTVQELHDHLVGLLAEHADKQVVCWFPDLGYGGNAPSEIISVGPGTASEDERTYCSKNGETIAHQFIAMRMNASC